MSWIRRRPFAAIAVFALALRAASAVLTEYKPIFPAYYYTDADVTRVAALQALDDERAGRVATIKGTLAERIQTRISIGVYRAFGPRPLPIKFLNALMGALGVAALGWALSFAFPVEVALAAAFLVAVWPSHVFYTSQNLKEAPADLLAYAALGGALAAGLDPAAPGGRAAAFAAASALALLAAGFYRSYILLTLSAALLLALGLAAWTSRARRVNALATAAVLMATVAAYPAASRAFIDSFSAGAPRTLDKHVVPALIPITYDGRAADAVDRPTSPSGISEFRATRQFYDRDYAKRMADGREIGTQIYPDVRFKTWSDVLAYLPKGAFTVLFMPLPGLYPMDGKLGRYAAAGENLILLLIAALAAVGVARGPKDPARLCLLAFFAAMTVGAALLELDLGSAGRHKLLYLPMLFPFAAEELFRLLGRKEPP